MTVEQRRTLVAGMSDSNQRTSIGVLLSSDVKQRLSEIAKNEHRSLSGQAEFFLVKAVEQWESTFDTNKEKGAA